MYNACKKSYDKFYSDIKDLIFVLNKKKNSDLKYKIEYEYKK